MNSPQEFAEVLTGLRRLAASGFAGGAAMATIMRTRGSTFRRPGARMLICGDGMVIRSLSGGCPQADIVANARDVIGTGQARIVRYDRERGLDALIEMGCEGELEVLIEPLRGAQDLDGFTAVERCLDTRATGFLATAFARNGECLTPRPRRLVWAGSEVASDGFGDPRLASAVIASRPPIVGPAQPLVERFEAADGATDVLIEPLQPPHALVLMGVNECSLALARLAASLGWVTTLVDHRDDVLEAAILPQNVRRLPSTPESLHKHVTFDGRSSVVVMTFNLERDIAYMSALRDAPLAYFGALGSRARCAKLRDATGLAAPQLRAPAGLDLGSETPEEIALAVAAEILAVVTGHGGGVLSTTSGPIH